VVRDRRDGSVRNIFIDCFSARHWQLRSDGKYVVGGINEAICERVCTTYADRRRSAN